MSKEKPLIKVKKEIDKGLANARQKVRVTISVNNVGNAPAYDVEIEDLLPKGLELVSSVETFTKVNVIEPQGSYIRSFDVTSKTARRYRLPPTTVAYYKKKGLFRGKSYHAKSTGNPSISFLKSEITSFPKVITFLTTFNNTSRKRLRISGTVHVNNKRGETVKILKHEPVNVKPDEKHVLKDTWTVPEDIERGTYRALSIVVYETKSEKKEIRTEKKLVI